MAAILCTALCLSSLSMPLARVLFYNAEVKTWDVIVIGGGIIGLSLSLALRKRGASVLVVERGEPGREASHAAGGMLVDCSLETPAALQASCHRQRPHVSGLCARDSNSIRESNIDLRDHGTIVFPPPEHVYERPGFSLETSASLSL